MSDRRARLAAFIAARRGAPFVWGANDCCLFAADCALELTGVDIAAPLRGYCTRFGALRALKRAGFASVASYIAATLPRAVRARAGDWILHPQPPLDALAVADGRGGCWHMGEQTGLTRLPIGEAATAWSI